MPDRENSEGIQQPNLNVGADVLDFNCKSSSPSKAFLPAAMEELGASNVERKGKAQWTRATVIIFCIICKKQLDGNRRGGTIRKFCWQKIAKQFQKETGITYTKSQMKNKWDQLKKDYKAWKSLLKGQTGLGWNPEKGTIDADDDWWEAKLKENHDWAKFRQAGIDPELLEKLEDCFLNIVATGDDSSPPSGGLPHSAFFVDISRSDDQNDSGFQDVDVSLGNVSEDIETERIDLTSEGTRKKVQKRSSNLLPSTQDRMAKKAKGAAMISEQISRMNEGMQTHNAIVQDRMKRLGPTITDAIRVLHTMEKEVPKASPLYHFALKLFYNKDKRESFMAMDEDWLRLWYLQTEEKETNLFSSNLLDLINHHTHEVEHLRHCIASYTSQLEQAENRLQESTSLLARFRGRHNSTNDKEGHTTDKETL